MLYGGANFIPIAVPRFCLSVFFPNVNMLFFNTTSAKSIMFCRTSDFTLTCRKNRFDFILPKVYA